MQNASHLCSGQQRPVLKLSSPTTKQCCCKSCTYCLLRLLANRAHPVWVTMLQKSGCCSRPTPMVVHMLNLLCMSWKHGRTVSTACMHQGTGVPPKPQECRTFFSSSMPLLSSCEKLRSRRGAGLLLRIWCWLVL